MPRRCTSLERIRSGLLWSAAPVHRLIPSLAERDSCRPPPVRRGKRPQDVRLIRLTPAQPPMLPGQDRWLGGGEAANAIGSRERPNGRVDGSTSVKTGMSRSPGNMRGGKHAGTDRWRSERVSSRSMIPRRRWRQNWSGRVARSSV